MEPCIMTCPVCSTPADVEVPTPERLAELEMQAHSSAVSFDCTTCGAQTAVRGVTTDTTRAHSIV
jgi:predicted RNA-binding Zn-ribbon protein involved in translation (DUF1610 family)